MENNLVFIIIQIVGIAILLFEIMYVCLQKPSNLQKTLLVLCITCLISFVGYLLELAADNEQTAMYGCVIGYVSKPYSLLAALVFFLEYSNIKYHKGIIIGLFVYFVFISVMVFTNPYHYLYYSSVSFKPQLGSGLIVGHGPFWYVYMISTILMFIGYVVIVIVEFKRAATKQARKMVLVALAMVLCGVAGLIAFITTLTAGYDATLAGTFLGSICLLVLLIRYKLFDSLTLAKEKHLIDSNDGMIIMDARYKITFFNEMALKLIPELADNGKVKFKDSVILDELDNRNLNDLIFYNDRVYQLSIDTVTKNKKKSSIILGKTYIFHDITDSYNYTQTLHNDIEKATYRIKGIQRSVLVSFANLVEARDGYTGQHVKNVSKYAKLLAMELKKNRKYSKIINDEFIDMIDECAPLHDVGKIRIPDAILGKPGKLTKEEFDVMKTHTVEGGKIIDDVFKDIEEANYVEMSKDLVMYHHEWWDGSGYPQGLKGEDIPLSARIMAISDVYDALRMERPYKKAFSKEESIEIMKSEKGTHFDPELLDIFLKVVDYID